MEQPSATVHDHVHFHTPGAAPPLVGDAVHLAALARQGSAAAYEALTLCCTRGPQLRRAAALRLLPGLVPFQPVLPILERVDRPLEPLLVRMTVAQVRPLVSDPRDCEPIYRSVQQSLVEAFVQAERERHRKRRGKRRTERTAAPGADVEPGAPPFSGGLAGHLRNAKAVATSLYDYRFECADGSIGALQERHVEEFLLEYAPRRLLLEPEARRQTPEQLTRHFYWLGRVGRLLPKSIKGLCQAALAAMPAYRLSLSAQPGSPRALLQSAERAGVALNDARALHRHMTLQGLDLHDEFAPVWSE